MWIFYKVMYPRAPKSMMPQKGDVIEPRNCNFCGNSLAEYRGVIETAPTELNSSINSDITNDSVSDTTNAVSDTINTASDLDSPIKDSSTKANGELFFCNYEHQADFHAGKTYQY
ncbi:uncharacterized protein H4W00_000904 [Psychrobacter sp. PL19]|uniref:hypothetical protein n=1 Tax=Psychrobacter sp. PL19 TaxID=2760711 RepID=UPI001AE74B14